MFNRKPSRTFREEAADFVFAQSPDAVFMVEDGVIIDCNPAMEALMGCTHQQIVGMSPAKLSPPTQPCGGDSASLAREVTAKIMAKGHHRQEWVYKRADGAPLPVLATLMRATLNGRAAMICTWQDMREVVALREAEQAARARQEAEAQDQQAVVKQLAESLRRLAAADLACQLETAFAPAYEGLRQDFNTAVKQLRGAIGQVAEKANGMQANAWEISRAADDLSRRTEQQAASIEETAAALDVITGTVQQMAQSAQDTAKVVATAREQTGVSVAIVDRAVTAMKGIDDSSREISQIIGVIDEIAFQTNLLALNAGVEAARAGDSGKGFAVVAQEVRALAQRSAEAAKEIKGLISTSTQQVATGVQLVGETGEALGRIATEVAAIDRLSRDIADAARNQAVGLREINGAVSQMDQVVQQNAAMVEQSTAASRAMADEARLLSQLSGAFQLNASDARRRAA